MPTSLGVDDLGPQELLTDATQAAATLAALNHPHSSGTTESDAVRRSIAARTATATASTNSGGQYWPQPYPGPHQDISRLLQCTDQLAHQMQDVLSRLSYLTEVAGSNGQPALPQLRGICTCADTQFRQTSALLASATHIDFLTFMVPPVHFDFDLAWYM